ncbi:hypothetical protein ANOBCDAF_04693 [Pleomorphomonas sp. T1.2MG-36]|nr:hypothetical protein ANOBCDAF_04693 [Pleomorphomonas sp. T1.2MG-36]
MTYSVSGMFDHLKGLDLSWQKSRPRHLRPMLPPRRRSKRGLAKAVKRIAKLHEGKQIQLWLQDEARVGRKGRNAHVWFEKGILPVMRTDKRFKSVYIYGAIHPGTDDAFALILPRADTEMMRLDFDTFAQSLPTDVHVVLVLDKDGWHVTGRLKPPDNLSLVHLPAYSFELNPSNASGSTSRSASFPTASSTTSMPSSKPAQRLGTT